MVAIRETQTKPEFPVYMIASDDGVLLAKIDGDECVMVFHTWQLAADYIAQSMTLPPKIKLFPLVVPDAVTLLEGLKSLPADIKCAIWDVTTKPERFKHNGIDELLLALESA